MSVVFLALAVGLVSAPVTGAASSAAAASRHGGVALAPNPTSAAAAALPTTITSGADLTWGLKRTWRSYAPAPAVAAGAAVVEENWGLSEPGYNLTWDLESGSYDADTGSTVLSYAGTAHWTKYRAVSEMGWTAPPEYAGSDPDPYILDVTFTDPEVSITPEAATISVNVQSRDQTTWNMVDHGRIVVATLDISGVEPTVTDGTGGATATTSWPELSTTAAPGLGEAGMYQAGTVLDQISFAYDGLGGAPALDETFADPGTDVLVAAATTMIKENAQDYPAEVWWVEQDEQLVHYSYRDASGNYAYQAFDLTTMTNIGEPLVVTAANRIRTSQLWDTARDRIIYRSGSEASATHWITFDRDAGRYVTGTLASGALTTPAAYDPINDRAYQISLVQPAEVEAGDSDNYAWKLLTWDFSPDGTTLTAGATYTLPNADTGFDNSFTYTGVSQGIGTSGGTARLNSTVLPDGSLLMLNSRQPSPVPDPDTGESVYPDIDVPGAYRMVLYDDTLTATRTPIAGTEFNNADGTAQTQGAFDQVIRGPNGLVALVKNSAVVQTLTVTDAGDIADIDDQVSLPYGAREASTTYNVSIDQVDGTVWYGARDSQRLMGVRNGRLVSSAAYPERSARGGLVVAGGDHQVYSLTTAGVIVGRAAVYSVTRFDLFGTTPTVTFQPTAATVTLATDEASKDANFTVAATGRPDSSVQWQLKAPGADRFTALPGQTGTTGLLSATRDLDGAQVRAIVSNAAGRVATDAVTLTVHAAPRVTTAPTHQAVVEGADATFGLAGDGNATPAVTWQRRVDGYWTDIVATDDNFALENDDPDTAAVEGDLTVLATNLDQTGSKFRAKLTNPVATTYTPVVTLTVTEASDAVRVIDGGAIDWGVKESFRTYVVGPIAHGAITTADGASVNPDGTYRFPVATGASGTGGAYDPDGATEVDLAGTVRFTGHNGALDLTITNPELHLNNPAGPAAGSGTLVADVDSKDMETGQVVQHTDVELATLDTTTGLTTPANGPADTVTLTDVPATLTEEGAPAFAGFYAAGATLDPIDATLQLGDEVPGGGSTPVDTTTNLTLTDTRYAYGQQVNARISVTDGTTGAGLAPTGQVTLTVDAKTRTATLTAGRAAVSLPTLTPGRHQVRVTYAGNDQARASTAAATVVITKANPRITLKPANKTIKRTQRAKVTVKVTTPGAAQMRPTGQIVIRDGSRIIKTAQLRGGHRGTITLRLPRLSRGTHHLSAAVSSTRFTSRASSNYRTLTVVR